MEPVSSQHKMEPLSSPDSVQSQYKMEPLSSWLISMQLEENVVMNRWQSGRIHKLPASVIDVKPKDYKPQTVSFGPYHYREPNLIAMEEHKHRAVVHFFRRSKRTISECREELKEVVDDLKLAYTSLDPQWQSDTDAFLKLMIVDGCFMLEILRLATVDDRRKVNDYDTTDPIFSWRGLIYNLPSIKRDMLLLQNQLPILVLHRLLAAVDHGDIHTGYDRIDQSIQKLIHDFFFPYIKIKFTSSDHHHVLDVCRKILAYEVPAEEPYDPMPLWFSPVPLWFLQMPLWILQMPLWFLPTSRRGIGLVWSAREMDEAGIHIKISRTESLRDISFQGGILRLPAILVDDLTEIQFLNLMASERFQAGISPDVTSYIFFMAQIIHSASDVRFLSSRGIIQNWGSGTNEDIAQLFLFLSKDIILDPDNHLSIICYGLQDYCYKNRRRASFHRTYLRNPWARITLIASIVLFFLTLAQTVYTIIPYHKK